MEISDRELRKKWHEWRRGLMAEAGWIDHETRSTVGAMLESNWHGFVAGYRIAQQEAEHGGER